MHGLADALIDTKRVELHIQPGSPTSCIDHILTNLRTELSVNREFLVFNLVHTKKSVGSTYFVRKEIRCLRTGGLRMVSMTTDDSAGGYTIAHRSTQPVALRVLDHLKKGTSRQVSSTLLGNQSHEIRQCKI